MLRGLIRNIGASKRIAAFQFEAVHEETGSGFFDAFGEHGYTTRAYFNDRIRAVRGDFYGVVEHKNLEMKYLPMEGRPAWDAIAEEAQRFKPSLVYFNTFQRDGIANWARQFERPILGVVHNPDLFAASGPCRALAREGKLDAFCLAPHVVTALLERVPELEGRAHLNNHLAWMNEGADRYSENPEVLEILVSGAVMFANRDFVSLLEVLRRGEADNQRPFRIVIASGGPDRQRLENAVAEHGLGRFFDLVPLDPASQRVPHAIYLERLYRCHAVLALLPPGRSDYLETKITTGILAALGAGRPIITTKRYGEVYGFTPIETPEDRPAAIGLADFSAATLAHRRAESLAIRANGILQNRATLKRVLDRIVSDGWR